MVDRIPPGLAHLSLSIDSLHPDPSNARKHSQRNLDAIKASLAKFGQRKAIVVQRDGMIVRAGNGTLEAAKALGWDEIAALVIDEDNATAAQYAIADNRTAELAEWDNQTLASLLDGMDDDTRQMLSFDEKDIQELVEITQAERELYTGKVSTPVYEPRGVCPSVAELYNYEKTNDLLAEIETADLPDDVRLFLKLAAERHTVFDFSKVADFYAHASPEVQHLMERSVLVIIDDKKAIEGGFVQMSERVMSMFQEDYDNA